LETSDLAGLLLVELAGVFFNHWFARKEWPQDAAAPVVVLFSPLQMVVDLLAF
jgi:hypothetical protein